MDQLVRRMRRNIEENVRVDETWDAIQILCGAAQMPDWDEAFELTFGISRQELAEKNSQPPPY